MSDRAYGVKQSDFTAQTSIPSGSFLGFFANGYNYKISYANFLSGLGVTGTIVQDGAVTGTPVLDVQGTVNNIRNLEDGAGIVTNVSAENGITIAHNFTVDTTGEPLMLNISDPSPTFVSLVAGTGINITTSGDTIEIEAQQAAIYGQVYMQGNSTATVIASTATPVLVAGTWTVDLQGSFTGTTGGRLTYTGSETQICRVAASLSLDPVSGSNQHISVYIAKNGSTIAGSRQISHISHGAENNMSVTWQLSLATNDYIELFVQNGTATNNITVSRVVLSIH
jgi:predicted secreted protein